jgi:hypothetical protein
VKLNIFSALFTNPVITQLINCLHTMNLFCHVVLKVQTYFDLLFQYLIRLHYLCYFVHFYKSNTYYNKSMSRPIPKISSHTTCYYACTCISVKEIIVSGPQSYKPTPGGLFINGDNKC